MNQSSTAVVIEELSRGLKPVQPLWALWKRFTLTTMASCLTLVAALAYWELRDDLSDELKDIYFILVVTITLAVAIHSIFSALDLSVPGKEAAKIKWRIGVLIFALGLTFLTQLHRDYSWPTWEQWKWGFYWPCISKELVMASIPAFVLLVLIKRAAPTFLSFTGFLTFAAAGFTGLLGVTLYCPSCNGLHLCCSHFLPALSLAFFGGAIGRLLLRW